MDYYPAFPRAGCVLARTGMKVRGAASADDPTCGLDGRRCDIEADDVPRPCGQWKPRQSHESVR